MTWFARIAAGLVGLVLLILADAVWEEVATASLASPWWVLLLGYGFYALSAVVVFLVFFRWSRSRIVLRSKGAVAKHRKALAGLVLAFGLFGLVGSLLYLTVLDSTTSPTLNVLTDVLPLGGIVWLIVISLASLAVGWGLFIGKNLSRFREQFSRQLAEADASAGAIA